MRLEWSKPRYDPSLFSSTFSLLLQDISFSFIFKNKQDVIFTFETIAELLTNEVVNFEQLGQDNVLKQRVRYLNSIYDTS